jgi:hypothetical protein
LQTCFIHYVVAKLAASSSTTTFRIFRPLLGVCGIFFSVFHFFRIRHLTPLFGTFLCILKHVPSFHLQLKYQKYIILMLELAMNIFLKGIQTLKVSTWKMMKLLAGWFPRFFPTRPSQTRAFDGPTQSSFFFLIGVGSWVFLGGFSTGPALLPGGQSFFFFLMGVGSWVFLGGFSAGPALLPGGQSFVFFAGFEARVLFVARRLAGCFFGFEAFFGLQVLGCFLGFGGAFGFSGSQISSSVGAHAGERGSG